MKELISVIIPVYNVEKYLRCCIESVMQQKYETLQIILVDDGSTDSSGKICDNYARQDERIEVIHQENGGVSKARNTGIAVAKGNYLAFLDSDDMWSPFFLAEAYDILISQKADIILCDLQRFREDEKVCIDKKIENYKVEILSPREANLRIYKSGDVAYTIMSNKLFKAEIFSGVEFPVNKIHEDTFLTYKLYYRAHRVAVISAKMYYYRFRLNSIMTEAIKEKNLNMLEAFDQRLQYYKELSDDDLYFLCLLRKMESVIVLYNKALKTKSEQKVADAIYEQGKVTYAEMERNKHLYKSRKLFCYGMFLKHPRCYCKLMRISDFIKKIRRKLVKIFKKLKGE